MRFGRNVVWNRTLSLSRLHFLRRSFTKLPKDVTTKPMPTAYEASKVEEQWYKWWEANNFFRGERNDPSAEKFSMVLPPPNITGTLHLGHALTCAIEDSLVCWNRMKGKDAVWFPGSDHAGIATQVIVEKKLKTLGTSREILGREKFLEEVWKWKNDKQETIYKQLKALGATLQWDKSVFTMDPNMCYAVNEAFIQLHRTGKIFRKESLINWSCQLQSAISEIEVEHREIEGPTLVQVPGYDKTVPFGQLYQFGYKLSDDKDGALILVSTTRPETIAGDTAIAVHPEDDRYAKYIGKFARHPIRHEDIPIIADPAVDKFFGTGALKITPGHDFCDFDIAERHGLKKLNIFDNRGNANKVCGAYQGLPRFELREKIIHFLNESKLLKGTSPHAMSIPFCSRSGDVIEPLLRPQWFVNTKDMASRAVEAVEKGHLKIHPAHFEQVWFDWLRNSRDWCISRQLWWGHQIPAYRIPSVGEGKENAWIAAHNPQEATDFAAKQGIPSSPMYRDEDVLDTWFSSSLFPFAACGWPKKTADLQNLFPLDVMETGHDILFFWVARMVMLSLELTGKLPFKEIVLHGIICDSHGRKMSKSLGNVIDPMDIIYGASLQKLEEGLESSRHSGHLSQQEFLKAREEKRKLFPNGMPQTGADALRFTLCCYNVKNHFINLDMDTLKRNRLFCNKIWQATRFLFLLLERMPAPEVAMDLNATGQSPTGGLLINRWIMHRLHAMVARVNSGFSRYDFHQATDALYSFLYGDLCDVYVEAVKLYAGRDLTETVLVMARCLDVSLRCLTPFMPFLSEELYQRLHSQLSNHRIDSQRARSILIAEFPEEDQFVQWKQEELDRDMETLFLAVAELRGVKLQYGLAKAKPEVDFVTPSESILRQKDQYSALIRTLAAVGDVNISSTIDPMKQKGAAMVSRTVNNGSVYVNITGMIDQDKEMKKSQAKMKKLVDSLARLETTMKAPAYSKTAPIQVQESHRKKVMAMQSEIVELENYVKILRTK